MAYLDYEAIRAQARGRWDYLLAALAPELEEALEKAPRHVSCPVHGGQDGFRMFKDHEENGGAMCNTCGSFPSGFRVLQWLKGWDFPQALEAVVELLNGGIPDIRPRPRNGNGNGHAKGHDDEKLRRRLRRTWQEAVALQDSWAKPARLYLERRGISPVTFYATGCKCHPHLAYWEQGKGAVGKFPTLLALLWDPQGQAVTLHRTYLTPDGCKAPVENPKKTMPYPSDRKLAGALVRLGQPNGTLGLAEGIETALAVQEATGMVCWAATSATLLEAAVLPHSVRQVVVWADNDLKGAGQMAALCLAAQLVKEGRKVKVEVPDRPAEMKSWDWNDVLANQGPRGFPERFLGAA
jgi:putative DNA primase/helicase